MNLLFNYLSLAACVFVRVTNEEVTTKTDTLHIDNTPDITSDKVKEATKNKDGESEHVKGAKQAQFDMTDFKVTKLKSINFEDEAEADVAACLSSVDPEKKETIKKNMRTINGKVEYIPVDPSNINDEEMKIANCLEKQANERKDTQTTIENKKETATQTNNENVATTSTDRIINANSNKTKPNLDENKTEASNKTNNDVTDTSTDKTEATLDAVVEVDEINEEKQGRRDTEYQFAPLDYYDDELVFDNTTCPDKVEIIELHLSEVKRYDMECHMITYWTGLADTEQMLLM